MASTSDGAYNGTKLSIQVCLLCFSNCSRMFCYLKEKIFRLLSKICFSFVSATFITSSEFLVGRANKVASSFPDTSSFCRLATVVALNILWKTNWNRVPELCSSPYLLDHLYVNSVFCILYRICTVSWNLLILLHGSSRKCHRI